MVVNWVPRQHFNHSTSSILTTRSFSRVLTPSVVNCQVNSCRQPLSWLSVVSDLSVQTLAESSFHDTLLVCVVQESTHRRVTASLLDVQLVVVRQRCASCNILPVCIVQWLTVSVEVVSVSKPICRIQRPVKFVTLRVTTPLVFVFKTLHESVAPFLSVQSIHLTCDRRNAYRTLVRDLCTVATLLTTLSSNQDNTVSTTSTVDSCCRSILQDFH